MTVDAEPADAGPARPPSVDQLARSLRDTGLPHAICVDIARSAIRDHDVEGAQRLAIAYRRSQLAFYEKHHPHWVPFLRMYLRLRGFS